MTGESYQQPCEEVVHRVDEEMVWSDENKKKHKTNKTGLKQGHLKLLHVSKNVPTRHHYKKPHR